MTNPGSATWNVVLGASICLALFFGCDEEESLVAAHPNQPRATIYLSQSTIARCETLMIDVQLTNYSDTLVWIEYCCEPLRYYVTDIFEREIHWCPEDTCAPCAVYDARTLWPQHTMGKRFSFCTGMGESCLPTGKYLVHAGDERKRYSWAVAAFTIRD